METVCPASPRLVHHSLLLIRAQYTTAELKMKWDETSRVGVGNLVRSMALAPSPHTRFIDSKMLKMEGYLEVILSTFLGKSRGLSSYDYDKASVSMCSFNPHRLHIPSVLGSGLGPEDREIMVKRPCLEGAYSLCRERQCLYMDHQTESGPSAQEAKKGT